MDNIWLLLAFLTMYFLPWIVASVREKQNKLAIGLTNLFFGWTLIGWAVALIWAVSKDRHVSGHEQPNNS